MPKFGQAQFGNDIFGDAKLARGDYKRAIHRVPLGFTIRKQLGKRIIFRVRTGNGHAGAIAGEKYQDKFAYVVPGNIDNAESEPYRITLASAVDHWQNVLTPQEQAAYNERATRGLRMSGYNLFIREAMKGIYHMFTSRGDPAGWDFTATDFIDDDTWRDLDLSAIIPAIARAVLMEIDVRSPLKDDEIEFRKYGNTNTINHTGAKVKVNNESQHKTLIVEMTSARKIEYNADAANWTLINLVVRGWWT